MGKAKKERRSARRSSGPLDGSARPAAAASSEPASVPMVLALDSVEAHERETAAVSIANVVDDDASVVPQLVAAGCIRKLVQRVLDPKAGVRLACIGALRNLAVAGGADVCVSIVQADALTTLLDLFPTLALVASRDVPDTDVQKRDAYDTLAQLVPLLAYLVESVEEAATGVISNAKCLAALRTAVALSPGLMGDTLNLVCAVTDDYSAAVAALADWADIALRVAQDTSASPLHRALARVILVNLSPAATQAVVDDVIAAVLEFDPQQQFVEVVLPDLAARSKEDASPVLQQWQEHTRGLRVSLELLANVLNVGDADDAAPAALVDLASHQQLLSVVSALCAFPPTSWVTLLAARADVAASATRDCDAVQDRAFAVLNNMLLLQPPPGQGDSGQHAWRTPLWHSLCTLCAIAADRGARDVLEHATLAMWTLARVSPLHLEPSEQELAGIVRFAAVASDPAIGRHLVGVLGCLAQAAASASAMQQQLVQALVATAKSTVAPIDVSVAAVDALIDAFAADADETDPSVLLPDSLESRVLVELQGLSLTQRVRQAIAGNACEDREQALLTVENLAGFLDYKSKRRAAAS